MNHTKFVIKQWLDHRRTFGFTRPFSVRVGGGEGPFGEVPRLRAKWHRASYGWWCSPDPDVVARLTLNEDGFWISEVTADRYDYTSGAVHCATRHEARKVTVSLLNVLHSVATSVKGYRKVVVDWLDENGIEHPETATPPDQGSHGRYP